MFFARLFDAASAGAAADAIAAALSATNSSTEAAAAVPAALRAAMGEGCTAPPPVSVVTTSAPVLLSYLPFFLLTHPPRSVAYVAVVANTEEVVAKKWPYLVEAALFILDDVVLPAAGGGDGRRGAAQAVRYVLGECEDADAALRALRELCEADGGLCREERLEVRSMWRRCLDSLYKSYAFFHGSLWKAAAAASAAAAAEGATGDAVPPASPPSLQPILTHKTRPLRKMFLSRLAAGFGAIVEGCLSAAPSPLAAPTQEAAPAKAANAASSAATTTTTAEGPPFALASDL
eukprot:Rhum_TRINITY_DN14827_c11_g1::Rhum_TRINITY_DN14827_c11_g1_i1::g.122105::m.122105